MCSVVGLVGPGAMFGYAFRPKDTLLITVGAGVQAWYQPTTDSGARVLGVQVLEDDRLVVVQVLLGECHVVKASDASAAKL